MRVVLFSILAAFASPLLADGVSGSCERDGKRLVFTDGIAFQDARDAQGVVTTTIYLTAKPLDRAALAKCAACAAAPGESTFTSPRGDVIEAQRIVLDPSRMAAQIVSGIGFIGAGLIFVRRDSVRGLTTAASVWVTAAIGAAAGAGLPVLAAVAAGAYLVIVALAFPAVTRRLPRSATAVSSLRVRYLDGRGVLRQLLQVVTSRGFVIDEVSAGPAGRYGAGPPGPPPAEGKRLVEVTLQVHGKQPVSDLAAALSDVPDVDAVLVDDANAIDG